MSLLKKGSIGFLLLLLLLLGILVGLVTTSTGLHLLLNSAARWVPGLEIASVSGGWRDLNLKNINYRMLGLDVSIGDISLGVDTQCLWQSQLCVSKLMLADVSVKVNSAEMPPSSPSEPDPNPLNLSTRYPIILHGLQLKNIHVAVDGTDIALGNFSGGAEWKGRLLTLLPINIDDVILHLPPAAAEAPSSKSQKAAASEPLGETLKNIFAKPLLESLPNIHLPMDFTVQSIEGKNWQLQGDTPFIVNKVVLEGNMLNSTVTLARFDVSTPQGSASLVGNATLDKNWPVELTLNSALNLPDLKGEKLKLTLKGEVQKQLTVALNASGPVSVQLNGQAALTEVGLPLQLTVQGKQLRWPLIGKPDYQLDDLRLRFNGKSSAYDISLRGNVSGIDIPPATLTLDGKGNSEQLTITRLRLSALQGHADLNGVLDWKQAISWKASLALDGLNTAQQWPEWPAKLAGSIKSRGSVYGGNWLIAFPEIQLEGRVKQQPVRVKGTIDGDEGGNWTIPQLDVLLGGNTLSLKGELSKNWNVDAQINAPRLDGFLPGFGGTIHGQLKLRGSEKSPQILADLKAEALQWQTLRVGLLTLKGDVRSDKQIGGDVSVQLERLTDAAIKLNQLSLNVQGNEQQHRLNLRFNGEPVSGQLALQGSFNASQMRWKGSLSDVQFITPVGTWTTDHSVSLDYQNTVQKLVIGAHCWLNPNAELCLTQNATIGHSGNAQLSLKRFDLAMLKEFLPPETAIQGVFTGNAQARWQTVDGLPRAEITLEGMGVKLQQKVQDAVLPIAFDQLKLNAVFANNRAQLDWLVKLVNNGQMRGQLRVTDPTGRRGLSGQLEIDHISLKALAPILKNGEKATGELNGRLQFSGDVKRPQVRGQIGLEQLQVVAAWMPVEMTDGYLTVHFNGMTSSLQGAIKTTQGQLALSGNADWQRVNDWSAKVVAKGNQLRVTVPPMVRVDVSPDIVFEATPQKLSLTGTVAIPWARITVQDLPESVVAVSPHEVMLNDKLQPLTEKKTTIPVDTNLVVTLGNDIRLDAFGLKAQLKGYLRILQDSHGLSMNGQIRIPSGRFQAYGQDLIVQKGQILFTGPVSQPLINLEAIRNPDSTENNVTVGIRVNGIADAPKLDIFSEPAMSQQETLSYLLTGRGLSSSGDENGAMTSMLIGLGVAQSGKLVGKIGEAFGVSNLALDTEGVGDSSQVVVSGYVLPGLQIKYGVGIFDSLATLTLRYRLMPNLYLEAVSGIDQALDLLYQFEF